MNKHHVSQVIIEPKHEGSIIIINGHMEGDIEGVAKSIDLKSKLCSPCTFVWNFDFLVVSIAVVVNSLCEIVTYIIDTTLDVLPVPTDLAHKAVSL